MAKINQKHSASGKPARDSQETHISAPPLEAQLIQLIDDFAEFSDINAFLCHAFATSLSDHERINQEIISGARICSIWLQSRTSQLKADIRHVHARYVAEHMK